MRDFVQLLEKFQTREQVKHIIYKLRDSGFLKYKGKGSDTQYFLSDEALASQEIINRAVELGLEEMKKRGEITVRDQAKKRNKSSL
jgi:ATP-dependent DNA helicase RecG